MDDIRKEEIQKLTEEQARKIFPFEDVYESNDDFFQKYSSREILDWEILDAKALGFKVEETINKKLKQDDVVIEGVQLLPDLLENYNQNPFIKIFIFYKKDKEAILEGFHKNDNKDDWLLHGTHDKKTFEKAAEAFSYYGEFFEREAEKRGFVAINTEKNFEITIDSLIESIK